MVKSYLRYETAAVFGVVASVESNISYDSSGKFLLLPALEKVGVWHVRQGTCSKTLCPSSPSTSGHSLAVTSIAPSPSSLVASGYGDGCIRIWDLPKGSCETTLNGHKGAVSALRYNKVGSLLASGGRDNDIILWDVVGESGLYRLRGHRDQVTDLAFLEEGKRLVSSSKDKFLRVWDLDTQHCMQIISGHHSEIWSLDIDPEERYLVVGSADPELRVYTVLKQDQCSAAPSNEGDGSDGVMLSHNNWEVLKLFGEIKRQNKDRVATLRYNKSGTLLACQVAGKVVEIFRLLDESEAKRKSKRRIHRKEKKIDKKSAKNADGDVNQGAQEEEIMVSDVFKFLQTLRASKKICSISFCPTSPKGILASLALSLNNNSVEVYSVDSDAVNQTLVLELPGHRSDIRSLALSMDNSLLLSTSHNAVKIWNPSTCSCLRTIDSAYGLCSMFVPVVPNNRYALVGTKGGTIEIVDVASSTCVEVVLAHGGPLHSIAAIPDGSGFVTGSADHDVKFWDYSSIKKQDQDSKQFTISHARTMKMNDDVLKVVVSPNAKYIAVALLDCTVKVFFLGSLKFYVSLYGHKLPVLCMDISSDGDLMVTGSADKNLKIWGLDFGDCHKSLFAHADSVMDVKFVHNTHYVFSVGKDRLVKYWDADKFELLLTLEGHHAEIWCLAVSNRGDFIVTGSHDRSLRRWDRTEEPFFLEEEKEKRLQEMFESDLDGLESRYTPKEELPEEGTVAIAGKKTQETLTATDLIIDALDVAEVETNRIAECEEEKRRGRVLDFQPNILMLGLSPSDHVLRVVSSIRTNDLEQTLLALPFSDALKLLSYLKTWTNIPDKVELMCRVAAFLLQTHYCQLISTPSARPLVNSLKDAIYPRVKECKDTIGFNLAAMDHLKQLMAMKSDAPFRDAKTKVFEVRAKLSKRMESRTGTKIEKKKKKKQKMETTGHAHAWT